MKPPVYTMCCVKDRWFLVAPSEQTLARTFELTELRAVDSGKLDISQPAVNDNNDRHRQGFL